MGKVILLTGAPATGKSTLRKNLAATLENVTAFDYGKLLLDLKASQGAKVTYSALREQSANLVTHHDVRKIDEEVIRRVSKLRESTHVILDSHAVTREEYGFRAATYSMEQLSRLSLDGVLVLRCDPETVIARMDGDRQGRREVSVELAREHQLLQESTGLTYAIACGCPFFVLDTTVLSTDDVKNKAMELLTPLLTQEAE